MKIEDIEKILEKADVGPSKWELDNIVYWDRTTNPKTLISFLQRIKILHFTTSKTLSEEKELAKLIELLDETDLEECKELIELSDDDLKETFIENLARNNAIQVLTIGRIDTESMETACKLSPNDFILCAKRTQDLINSIQRLVIKGETLSNDVAGA